MNPVPSSEPTVSVLNRESEWFMQEVQPHAGKLKSYLQSSFPSVRDVDDVVQESFLQIWRVRAARPITSARGLLFTIARNVALNLAQRQRSAPVCTVGDLARVPAPDEQADAHESLSCEDKRRLLVEALATLPTRCRQVVVMCKLQRLPQREVARALGLSERAVESNVARAKERCIAYLHKRGIRSLHDT